eukprot:gb/GFBE01029896.1/.p1 GENE.gb/GFBE01029896.1/~~gb/GFBE01029896.1/.p1  ORF type:complete len:796 (+),score=111.86 gb/GFBE01029896.1/:1-2388(+)
MEQRSPEALDALSGSQASPSFSSQARQAYDYSLKNLLWKQAAFFAERLVAERPCDETTYLLGLAHFHNQEIARAQWHLTGNKLPEARYLLAKCCLQLKRWDHAEEALLPPSAGGNLDNVVNGAAGLFLLGQAQERQSRREQAVECYAKCLELCPFMWEAYERWSWLVLGSPSPSRSSTSSLAQATFSDEKFEKTFASLSAANQAPNGLPAAAAAAPTRGVPGAPERTLSGARGSPTARSPHAPSRGEPLAPSKGVQNRTVRERRDGRDGTGGAPVRALKTEDGPGRRSGTSSETSGGTGNESFSLASLLCKLGLALHAMHSFECQQSVQQLSTLPKRHYETGYVLDLVGQCHFELADYKKSEAAYQQAWKIEPRRAEGLEYYSTALWHLRKDVDLGRLAQQCLQWDRLKPQVWCVVGNCFSLQKEHDVAIKFFKRAIQVDPNFTYAYTLCGHEFVASEKFDKAVSMYETAIQVDPRHYNAWWGLGNIYNRQEEHEHAKKHFVKALQVNGNNSVLLCYLGMVMDSLKQPRLALDCFDKAAQGEPQNGMAYFHKACILMSLERYDEALVDLKKVLSLAPREACVHFQLGKVHMKLQNHRKALHHFNIAMDLNRDSKDYHTIKQYIEKLHLSGVSEPDSTGEVPTAPRPNHVPGSRNVAAHVGVERDDGQRVVRGQMVTAYAAGLAPPGGASPVAGAQQMYGPLSPPGPCPAAADVNLHTPAAVRGSSTGVVWSAGASSGGTAAPHRGRTGYPPGQTRATGGQHRGGTPPSWASTAQGTPAGPAASAQLHAPGSTFRI